jgi:putative glycosyltransferase (TIGR04372 family)
MRFIAGSERNRPSATVDKTASMQRRRLIHLCLIVAGRVLNLLPPRVAFIFLMACDFAKLPFGHSLAQAYQPFAVSFLNNHPDGSFMGSIGKTLPALAARVLFSIGAYKEACKVILEHGLAVCSPKMTVLLARALFELGEFKKARDAASIRASRIEVHEAPDFGLLKSMLDVIDGDEPMAIENMTVASAKLPRLMRPHQNIAARPDPLYKPNYLDVLSGAPGKLFDLCNFAGQRVTHVGRGEVGLRLFERALVAQRELHNLPPPQLSPTLTRLLDSLEIKLDELQIIPEEWTTQIGHLGMLDMLFRMRDLGWWTGKPLIVARPNLVANAAFLRLFEGFGKLLIINDTDPVGDEALSLQRWYGLNFNVFQLPSGEFVPWQEAGALAIEQWERESRGDPLREQYDEVFGNFPEVAAAFAHIREDWGMKPDDWYVCLHTRDASHYFELSGTGQTHRNSPVDDYREAIRSITAKGGWVIRLGGPRSAKLPTMDRTIDYAFSPFKSDLMDIHLIRHAKAFIGTTSGLTNVAVSFGIPSALVNCITTDSQLWNSKVRFALKPVRLADGTMLTQRQLTSAPWRWRVFDAAVLGRSGGHPEDNSADEIFEAVREVLALAEGNSAEFEKSYDAEGLWSRWREKLSVPHYYGTSKPSLYYLKKHEEAFLAGTQEDRVKAASHGTAVV